MALQTARQLLRRQIAQRRRQRGQRHFTQRALVVGGREANQGQPGGAQRCDSGQDLGDGPQRGSLGFDGLIAMPDQAQGFALAQRHAHQRARRQPFLAGVAEQAAQAAVRGRGDGDGRLIAHASVTSEGKRKFTCEKRPKYLISNYFEGHPKNLWITLLIGRSRGPQSLESQGLS